MKKIILTAAVCLGGYVPLQGQVSLTIEKAMDIAEEHSPSLRRSHMNLERYQQNLVAQRASLKSKFSLNLNPVDYSKSRSFDNRLSQWYTNERFSATGTFQVDQPILWTDGVLSLINRFGWQDNNSNIDGTKTSNKAFSNDLYLQLSQPIFTYNKRKMELQQIEYDYENANISYALQRLSTEKDITQQFYSVYMAQSQLAITREELTNAQQSYEIIKNKVEADLAARDELFQAEVNLASARSSLEEQQVSLENSKDQLKQTLGMDLNEDIMVFAEVQIKPVEVNLEKAIQHGLESRLELRQREIESKELAFDMIKTKALNEFKGDIALSFGLIGDNRHLEKIYNNPTQNPRVAISFSVPIFDWGEKKARVKAQEVAQKIGHEIFELGHLVQRAVRAARHHVLEHRVHADHFRRVVALDAAEYALTPAILDGVGRMKMDVIPEIDLLARRPVQMDVDPHGRVSSSLNRVTPPCVLILLQFPRGHGARRSSYGLFHHHSRFYGAREATNGATISIFLIFLERCDLTCIFAAGGVK